MIQKAMLLELGEELKSQIFVEVAFVLRELDVSFHHILVYLKIFSISQVFFLRISLF